MSDDPDNAACRLVTSSSDDVPNPTNVNPMTMGEIPNDLAAKNSRLISADANTVVFRWKDYRAKDGDLLPGNGLPANHERG